MSEVGLPLDELDTPVLWVDLDLLQQNIKRLAEHMREARVQWRPHMKGIKVPAIAHQALDAGAIGVTCAKLGEAEVMVAAGITEILIANQVVGSNKIKRLVNLCRRGNVKVAVDNHANVETLGQAATVHGLEVGVVVEIDVGMRRAGVEPGRAAVTLSNLVHRTPGLRYCGVMGWEGHTISIADPFEREKEVREAVGRLTSTAALCQAEGLPVDIVSAGGSATLNVTPFLPGVTEIQAGGAIFSDLFYRACGVMTKCALFVRAMVTSRPTPERVIFDVGFKGLPPWKRNPRISNLSKIRSIRMSAEHGTVTLEEPNDSLQIGDMVDFVVGYGDQTVFLYDRLYGVRSGGIEVVWDIAARGQMR